MDTPTQVCMMIVGYVLKFLWDLGGDNDNKIQILDITGDIAGNINPDVPWCDNPIQDKIPWRTFQ